MQHTLNSISLYCFDGTRKFLLVVNSASSSIASRSLSYVLVYIFFFQGSTRGQLTIGVRLMAKLLWGGPVRSSYKES